MGLEETGRIGRIVVHPTNPNIVLRLRARPPHRAAAGARRLSAPPTAARTGSACSSSIRTPAAPAWPWTRTIRTCCSPACGRSRCTPTPCSAADRAAASTSRTTAAPPGSGSKVTACRTRRWARSTSPSRRRTAKRVYALIQTADQGSLWRSDDGGENWTVVSWQRALIGRAGYYIRLAVSRQRRRGAGGQQQLLDVHRRRQDVPHVPLGRRHPRHLDRSNQRQPHPRHPRRRHVHDHRSRQDFDHASRCRSGRCTTSRSTTTCRTTSTATCRTTAPCAARATRREVRRAGDRVCGRRPARRRSADAAPGPWDHNLGGCESGFTLPDLTDTNIVWATCYGNEVTRYDARTKMARSVSPWLHTLDSAPNEAKYRCHWTPPLAIDPFDHNTVYYGCQVIFRTTQRRHELDRDQSRSFHARTRAASSPRAASSATTSGQFYGEVVFSIAPSEIQKGLIWAGTNDGKVWYTRDAGAALERCHEEHHRACRRGESSRRSSRRTSTPARRTSRSIST